jgi:endonuclease/exonuclease/phosphatase family metal-dependent hydrolase
MQCDLQISLDGWDRTFLDLSSKMAEPFCSAWHLYCFRLVAPLDPQKFENCSTRVKEVATRVLIGLSLGVAGAAFYAAPIPLIGGALALGLGSKVVRAAGFGLQKEGYTHVLGTCPEKTLDPHNPQIKVMTWNICGVGGGMSLDHGGVAHWRSRLDAIAIKIKTEDPDVLVLQEIYDTALAEALIQKLQSEYAHFYLHLGPNVWGSVGGCMVLSKCAVHDFSHTSFTNNEWTLNRGFADLEIKAHPNDTLPCARIIGTHLTHGDALKDQNNRMLQVAQIVNHVTLKTLAIPTILTGDLNIERDTPEGVTLSSYLHHAYQSPEPTCTNQLAAQWGAKTSTIAEETIDYISLFKNTADSATLQECHLVEAFDESFNTKTALSDHHGLAVMMNIPFVIEENDG